MLSGGELEDRRACRFSKVAHLIRYPRVDYVSCPGILLVFWKESLDIITARCLSEKTGTRYQPRTIAEPLRGRQVSGASSCGTAATEQHATQYVFFEV